MSEECVSAYSGSRFAERPASFQYEGERLEITNVLDNWREPGALHFRVLVEDGRLFHLSFDEAADCWNIQILK